MGKIKEAPNRDELRDLISQFTIEECKEYYGVGDWAIHRWMEEHNITDRLRPRRPAPPREELDEALRRHTHKEVCHKYGIKYGTLRRWLKELKLNHHYYDSKTMLSLSAAARELGVSKMTLSLWFRKGLLPNAIKLNRTKAMVPQEDVQSLKAMIARGELVRRN